MNWLFRIVVRRAITKGSGRFAALGVVIALLKFIRRVSGAEPHTMYKHTMQPGDVLVVSEKKTPR